jgi:hypothetical protein
MEGSGFHTEERKVVGLHYPDRDMRVRVWVGGEDAFTFSLSDAGARFDVQTRRAGIEAICDACIEALGDDRPADDD